MRIVWQSTMHTEVREQGTDQTSLCYRGIAPTVSFGLTSLLLVPSSICMGIFGLDHPPYSHLLFTASLLSFQKFCVRFGQWNAKWTTKFSCFWLSPLCQQEPSLILQKQRRGPAQHRAQFWYRVRFCCRKMHQDCFEWNRCPSTLLKTESSVLIGQKRETNLGHVVPDDQFQGSALNLHSNWDEEKIIHVIFPNSIVLQMFLVSGIRQGWTCI